MTLVRDRSLQWVMERLEEQETEIQSLSDELAQERLELAQERLEKQAAVAELRRLKATLETA